MAEDYTPDKLLAGADFPALTSAGILLAGQNLKRGAVIGIITASGKMKLCDKASADGSQTAVHVLAADCDASAADTPCVVYETGPLNQNALIFGGATVVADVKAALRSRSIFLRDMRTL